MGDCQIHYIFSSRFCRINFDMCVNDFSLLFSSDIIWLCDFHQPRPVWICLSWCHFQVNSENVCVASKIKLKKEEHVWETISGLDHSKGFNLPPSGLKFTFYKEFILYLTKRIISGRLKYFQKKVRKKLC